MDSKPHRFKRKKKPPGHKPQHPSQSSNNQALKKWKEPEGSAQYSELLSKLAGRELECMVCMNQIGWRGKIWNCEKCRIPEHLTCIKKWKESSGIHWNCPACFFEYSSEPLYTCFCGKVENPQPHPMITPHSCGEVCGRNRGNDCPHLCPQQCHPGACPPCTSMAPMKSCFCGKTSFQPLCKDRHLGRSCEQLCEKLLNCKNHRCQKLCHEGACENCIEMKDQDCFCGKEIMRIGCAESPICNSVCGKVLDCGKHFCPEQCHDGSCSPCDLKPELVKRCPCGKNLIEMILINPRSSCTDHIPSCHGVCDKTLACGHKCKSICHLGSCPSCKATQEIPCRCTRTVQTIHCKDLGKEILCTKVCSSKKSCKKHKCHQICCLGLEDPYSDQHRCMETCEKMLKCGQHTCLSHCHIGNCEGCKVVTRNRIFCPCGRTFKDPPLRCGTAEMNLACSFKCDKQLPCGHNCKSLCHEGECPDCSLLVEKLCKCEKVCLPSRCGTGQVSCGKVCSKTLPCSHACVEKCHSGPCTDFPVSHLCKQKRVDCNHTCLATCHYPDACPDTPCKVKVTIKCACDSRSVSGVCSELKVLDCTDECFIIKRDKALGSTAKESYTEELVEFAKENLQFVKKLETKLAEVILIKAKTTFMPPMKDKQRWLCHELASNHYKLDTESLDKEPYRSVYIHLTDNARVPTPLLSEFVHLVNQGVEVEFEKKDVMASLLFYQLSSFVTSEDISEVLHKFAGDFFVKWENDHSAYAHFFSLHKCGEAEKLCKATPGQYSIVKLISNCPQEDTSGFKKRFRNAKKAKEVLEFEEEEKMDQAKEPVPQEKKTKKEKKEKKENDEERKGSIFQVLEDD